MDLKTVKVHVAQFEFPSCGCCFECNIGKLIGVEDVRLNLLDYTAVVEYDGDKWTSESLIQEMNELGFDASLIE